MGLAGPIETPPYAMLVASLPELGDLFGAKSTPISWLRLEQRLRGLSAEDKALLDAILDVLALRQLGMDDTDAALVLRARALVPRLPTPALRHLVEQQLELRTILAALRRRQRGEPAPPPELVWGHGRWLSTIRRNWNEPGLGVERAFPWVREAAAQIESGEAVALESLLMAQLWSLAGWLALAHGHDFDFTAIVLYVLRFLLLERRTAYDADIASRRFRSLIAAGAAPLAERMGP